MVEKEFECLEVSIVRDFNWLQKRERQGFFLSPEFPVAQYKLPEHLKEMGEEDLSRFNAVFHFYWDKFIVELMTELKRNPIVSTETTRSNQE